MPVGSCRGATVIAKADYNWHNQPIGLKSSTPTATATGTGTRGLQRAYSWQDATGYLDTLAGRTGEATDPTTWLSLDYAYDAGGNIRNIDGRAHKPAVTATDGTITSPAATLAGAWCYTYDGLNRLATAKTGVLPTNPDLNSTCVTNDGDNTVVGSKHHLAYSYSRDGLATYSDQASGASASFAYPTTGNPEGKQPVHGVTTITQSGNDDKKTMPLSAAGTIALTYDTVGRIASLTKTLANSSNGTQGTWYSYDTLGNLAQQTTGAQADAGDREVTDALYDADGMRVLRRTTTHKNNKASTTSTFYLGDTEITLTGVKNAPRTLLRTYTTPGGTPVATEENKGAGAGVGWTWLLADQQHNVRLTRDSAGIKRTNYLPNGAPTGNVNLAPGARGYLNKTHDPSGDIRLDHRNYTPGINILTTPDPLLVPYDPQSLNPYAYARNNPITLSDPTGLCAVSETGARVCNPGSYGLDYPDSPPAPTVSTVEVETETSSSLFAPLDSIATSVANLYQGAGQGMAASPMGGSAIPTQVWQGASDEAIAEQVAAAEELAVSSGLALIMIYAARAGLRAPGSGTPASGVSRLVPGGGLASHELAGGHTLARHVGLSADDLAARLAAQPNIPAASTCGSRSVAEDSIAASLDANKGAVAAWLKAGGGNSGSAFTHTLSRSVGTTLQRGASSPVEASTVRVVLRPSPSMPGGYRVHTAFPE